MMPYLIIVLSLVFFGRLQHLFRQRHGGCRLNADISTCQWQGGFKPERQLGEGSEIGCGTRSKKLVQAKLGLRV